LENFRPQADRHAIKTLLAPWPEIILPEMPHPVRQEILEFHLGNIFQQVFFEQGLAVLEITALEWFGFYEMSEHIS